MKPLELVAFRDYLSKKYQVPTPFLHYYEDQPHWIPGDGVEGYHVPRLPILHISKQAENPFRTKFKLSNRLRTDGS